MWPILRYSYGEEDMPSWFADEEKKHTSIQLPISKEDVFYYKERLKAINARPMKKVMESQARKKRKVCFGFRYLFAKMFSIWFRLV